MSDTPRTDTEVLIANLVDQKGVWYVRAQFPRDLERGLTTALSKLAAEEQAVMELERDKERLEKVENHILGGGEFHAYHAWKGSNQFKINGKHVHGIYYPTFRQALDAAMNKPNEKD